MMIDLPQRCFIGRVNPRWFARVRPLYLNYTGSDTLTDFQVRLTLTPADIPFEKLRDDKSDLLFVNDNNEAIPYWIEKADSNEIIVWLKFPEIYKRKEVFWLYYSNGNFSGLSNSESVFEFFDDFEGTSLDEDNWSIRTLGSSNTVDVSGGAVILTVTDTDENRQHAAIISKTNVGAGRTSTRGYAIDYKAKTEGSYAGASPGYISGCEYIGSGELLNDFYVHENNLMVYTNEDTDKFYLSKLEAGSETNFDSFGVTEINGYTYTATAKILKNDVTVIINEGEHLLSCTDDTDISEGPITFFASGGVDRGEKLTVYYVRVRKYAFPEPWISTR